MNNKTEKAFDGLLNPAQLKEFLLTHLNRIYCAKTHLYERLPELADLADFRDLKHAITETWEDIGKQIARMEEIFILMDEKPSLINCEELIEFMENGFNPIHEKSTVTSLRDLSILFYMTIVESIELASFQLLQMTANRMPDKQIQRLLLENFDEAKADRILFIQIAAKYMS